jgi:hypothetical protein
MDYLRTYAEEYGLTELVSNLANSPLVQGAILTIDRLWLHAWQLKEVGRLEEWEAFRRRLRRFWPFEDFTFFSDLTTPWFPLQQPDLSWRPTDWDSLCEIRGLSSSSPVCLTVCLRPQEFENSNQSVPDLSRAKLQVRFEVRPVARLSAGNRKRVRPLVGGVGISTGASTYGTLGGIVQNDLGDRYGVTCAHVAPTSTPVYHPAKADDSKAKQIGTCYTATNLRRFAATDACNLGSPNVLSVDAALVELRDTSSRLEILGVGSVAGVVRRNSMAPGQVASFAGRTSGHRTVEIGGLCLFYRLFFDGAAFCFHDLFEVRWPSFWQGCIRPVVKPGDSGAWVCTETHEGPGWAGQIIGESRHVGYAAFADNMLSTWQKVGLKLRVA